MSKTVLVLSGLGILILIVGVRLLFQSSLTQTTISPEGLTSKPTSPQERVVAIPENIISYTNSGYTPSSLKVKVGSSVSFQNNSNSSMWTATSPHPQHTSYPGSSISKCNGAEKATIFDACSGVASGGNWSFTFDKAGTWEYHNHLNPSHIGTIVVE